MSKVIFIENQLKYNAEAKKLLEEFQSFLKVEGLKEVRVLNCYHFIDVGEEEFEDFGNMLFDKRTDIKYESFEEVKYYDRAFRVSHKDGQYNQREDMMNEMLKLKYDSKGAVKTSKIILLKGVSDEEFERIKSYYINHVDSKEMALDDFHFEKPAKFEGEIEFVNGFIDMEEADLKGIQDDLSMDMDDLKFVRNYFKKEGRNPSVCELKMIDTYWSDHCRHTTFLTHITDIEVEEGLYKKVFEDVLASYQKSREYVHGGEKPICLMDLATINMKELKKKGILDNLEDTDEVNACSIEIKADIDGKDEDYLLMFKNETHNHPTEIEPYGGAHTCIGGGIRDPLSARSYVFQAMRITGAKSPLTPFEDTMENKLPQRKLCRMAMNGYSDYANQIGCTGGYVKEFYHDGFEAKRMELGALVSGVKKSDILRENPAAGDVILLLGARTGRDGLGAAVGSSKVQTVKSLEKAGAEVQKGNPYEERNIIRLFRNPKATKLIKKCNDFGAGGVSVAIGELADGLEIDLSKVKLKYEGLNDWEIALSESQERMAVVVSKENLQEFLSYVKQEDVDYSLVAKVTDENRIHMLFNGMTSVDVKREFLNTNGVRKHAKAVLTSPADADYLLKSVRKEQNSHLEECKGILRDINVASQKNLISNFDNSHGRGTILSQLGGKNMLTPQEGMVAKLPVENGKTTTCSIMTFGYDPYLSEQNEFLGGYYAVISSLAKQVALGADVDKIRLSFQEFYERLGDDALKWGKPLKSLLGAYKVLNEFELATIGGKDSMSGTFKDISVPPSLLSFAVSYDKVQNIVSKEFKKANSKVLFVEMRRDELGMIDLKKTKEIYKKMKEAVDKKLILSMSSVEHSILKTVLEMSLGNDIGADFADVEDFSQLYTNYLGSLIVEVSPENVEKLGFEIFELGSTIENYLKIEGEIINLNELKTTYTTVFDDVYSDVGNHYISLIKPYKMQKREYANVRISTPRAIIPILKGTIGEYDLKAALEAAGAKVDTVVFGFRSKAELEASIREFAQKLNDYDVLALASGALMGNEPEQKGAFIDFVLGHELLKDAFDKFLDDEDKLVLGVGDAFQSLIRLGLIEFGKVQKGTAIKILPNRDEVFVSSMAKVKVVSEKSAFMIKNSLGDVYNAPIATKVGRIEADYRVFEKLEANGQIVSVFEGRNLTDSKRRIEGLCSPNGRIFGCLSSVDRISEDLFKNLEITALPRIFESAMEYFK